MTWKERARRLNPPITPATRLRCEALLDQVEDALAVLPPDSAAARELASGLADLLADLEAMRRR
ncbi:hypothetical protein [Nocardioides sp. KR10-350]|uniref:hypothetical protein n=1 Tax=Nocardioides cheoyonin TaxID=3156615 RepID=UPI0032B41C2C